MILSFNMLDVICLFILVPVIVYLMLSSSSSSSASPRYRHGSFAPVRANGQAMWHVDGKDYMSAVADAIEAAKTEIMITDWQMNPEIFMKRPDSGVDSLHWRLDKMLLRKADQGVQVTILLYKEMELALDLGSAHVAKLLGNHKNIEVFRHPDTVTGLQNLFRWTHHEKIVIVDRNIAFVGGIDLCYGRWDTRNHELMDDYPIHPCVAENNASRDKPNHQRRRHARWVGKDYKNTFCAKEEKTDWDKPLEGYVGVERNEIPRMPWHDVSCSFTGEVVQDAVKHFTDRYNVITKPWWRRYWDYLIQYFYNTNQVTKQTSRTAHDQLPGIVDDSSADQPHKVITKPWWRSYWDSARQYLYNTSEVLKQGSGYNVYVQLLRSVDNWSAGQPHEHSIHNAYVDAIKNAKHFIYIENQFFISSQDMGEVDNEIQEALVERIVRAHKAEESFHVMVIIPLKPEFPGDWDAQNWDAKALQSVTFWNQATIFHGEYSLLSKLKRRNIPNEVAMKYFSVYSLRKYDLIGTHFVTEIVYVHSKIMIVDDRLAIIGSANINDRSMLGNRDSEIAVMIEDLDFVDGRMDGAEYMMGRFSHSLRCDLLKEHLGMDGDSEGDMKIKDPLANSFIEGVADLAKKNTGLFLLVFGKGLLPRDDVQDFEELKGCKDIPVRQEDTSQTRKILTEIKGTIVNHPSNFLSKDLKPDKILTRTNIVTVVKPDY